MNESGIIQVVIILRQAGFFLERFFGRAIILLFSKKRKLFPVRFLCSLLVAVPCYFLPAIRLGNYNYNYRVSCLFVFLCGIFLYQEKLALIFYGTITGWGIQHIAWNRLSVVFDLIPNVSSYPSSQILSLYYCGFIFFYGRFFLFFYLMHIQFRYSKQHFVSFLFATFRLLITRFLAQSVKKWNIPLRIYTSLVAFLSLVIRVAYPYFSGLIEKENVLINEKKNLERMLSLQAKQQELSKETIDVINRKFHDRKNQLLSIEHGKGEDSKQLAKEREKDIDIYKDIARTGNEAVDIIITQKSLLCSSKGIRFTYILDGKALSFRSRNDIVSLYGNIIDNAIEACESETGDYRLIKLRTYQQNSFVVIQEENYCHKLISFNKDGLPISSKKDSINHGYGTKSISYIIHNYKGQLERKQDGDVFSLSILLPIPGKERPETD